MERTSFDDDEMSSFDDDTTRDIGALEGIVFCGEDSTMSSCLDTDAATYRGLAFDGGFLPDVHRGVGGLDGLGPSLSELAPSPTHHYAKDQTKMMDRGELPAPPPPALNHVPALTDSVGFLSKDRVYIASEADVGNIISVVQEQCKVCECALGTVHADEARFSYSHFSREFLSLEFEVRVWSLAEPSRCSELLPRCPEGSGYMVEFHRMNGCSFRWKDFFLRLSAALVKSSRFFIASTARPPPPSFDCSLLGDDEDDDNGIDTLPCMKSMVRMLQGTLESQYAAAAALVQCCVTKQACDQLVDSGFLDEAQTILQQASLHGNDMPTAQFPLLRCILLVIATVVTCSDKSKAAVVGNPSMNRNINNLRATNPSIFTPALRPLSELVG